MALTVVIHIEGGTVSRVQADDPDYADVVIIDWDDPGAMALADNREVASRYFDLPTV